MKTEEQVHLWNRPTTGTECGLETADNIVGLNKRAEINCPACLASLLKQHAVEMPMVHEMRVNTSAYLMCNLDAVESMRDQYEEKMAELQGQLTHTTEICKGEQAGRAQLESKLAAEREKTARLEEQLRLSKAAYDTNLATLEWNHKQSANEWDNERFALEINCPASLPRQYAVEMPERIHDIFSGDEIIPKYEYKFVRYCDYEQILEDVEPMRDQYEEKIAELERSIDLLRKNGPFNKLESELAAEREKTARLEAALEERNNRGTGFAYVPKAQMEASVAKAREEALREAAEVVESCNRRGPYEAIRAGGEILSLIDKKLPSL